MKDFVLSMNCRSYPLLIDQPHLCEREWGAEAPLLLMAIKSQVCILCAIVSIHSSCAPFGISHPMSCTDYCCCCVFYS